MREPEYRPFECAPGIRQAAFERVAQVRSEDLHRRLDRMEQLMERLEKRLWLTVYGVAAAILSQAFQSLLSGNL